MPALPWVPWSAFLLALALSPDRKLYRLKLVHIEWSLAAALALGSVQLWRTAKWRRTALDHPVACLGLAAVAFHLLAPERSASGPELHRVLLGVLAFFATAWTLPDEATGRTAWLWAWAALAAGLAGFAAAFEGGRAQSTFGNPVLFGAFLAPSIALTAALAASAPGPSRWTALALAAVQFAGLWVSGTRASFLALAGALSLACLAAPLPRSWKAAGLLLASAAAAAIPFLFTRPVTHGLIWKDALKMWLDHPVLGAGLGRFHLEFPAYASPGLRALWPQSEVVVNFAHSEPVQFLAETGLLGAGLLLWLWIAFARSARPAAGPPEADGVRRAAFWAAVTLWLQCLLSPDMRFGVSWAVVFMLMAAASPAAETRLPGPPAARALAAGVLLALAGWVALRARDWQPAALPSEPSFFATPGETDAEVVRWLAQAVADPGNQSVHEHLGYLYAKRQNWAQATQHFERAISLDAAKAGPYNNLGNIRFMLGDREGAVRYWEAALAREPKLTDAHLNLAVAYHSQGRLKEASRHLERVLELDPGNAKALSLHRRMVE